MHCLAAGGHINHTWRVIMRVFPELFITGCLLCAAPLVQACDVMHHGAYEEDVFKEMDKNGDGVISKKEFDAYHSAQFKKFDLNHDGKITREEMEAVHDKMVDKCDTHADKGYKDFDARFDETDINNDGALSKDEAEIGMPMLFKHFDEIDTNKDGKITKEEVVAYMKKLHEHMQDQHMDKGMMAPDNKEMMKPADDGAKKPDPM